MRKLFSLKTLKQSTRDKSKLMRDQRKLSFLRKFQTQESLKNCAKSFLTMFTRPILTMLSESSEMKLWILTKLVSIMENGTLRQTNLMGTGTELDLTERWFGKTILETASLQGTAEASAFPEKAPSSSSSQATWTTMQMASANLNSPAA